MIKTDLAPHHCRIKKHHTKDTETVLTTFRDIASDSLASGELVRLSGGRRD
ncbi:MAG: hypothetical protein NUK65_07730 [Firmicutes bacterium]|nr:hypothetical protein [Bacillota bacterium]